MKKCQRQLLIALVMGSHPDQNRVALLYLGCLFEELKGAKPLSRISSLSPYEGERDKGGGVSKQSLFYCRFILVQAEMWYNEVVY
jgi:hypothetical protein